MTNLDQRVLEKATKFCPKLGLGKFAIKVNNFQELRYNLVVTEVVYGEKEKRNVIKLVDKLPFLEKDYAKMEERALAEQIKGHHTYPLKIVANANGYINKDSIGNNMPFALEVLFHEGFHNRDSDLLYLLLEESAAKFVGLKASKIFAQKQRKKNPDLFEGVEARIKEEEEKIENFLRIKDKRLEDINCGKIISQDDPNNNSFLYSLLPYNEFYKLFSDVFDSVGNFRAFIEIIKGLPNINAPQEGYGKAWKILNEIKQFK
jgi:hypothetical protein